MSLVSEIGRVISERRLAAKARGGRRDATRKDWRRLRVFEALEQRQMLDAASLSALPNEITISSANSYHYAFEGQPNCFIDSSTVEGLTASFVNGEQVAFTVLKTSTDGAVSSLGEVVIQLFSSEGEAPISSSQFMSLVFGDYYEGKTFHRIIDGFMFQGGSSDGYGYQGSDFANVPDEYSDVLTHSTRGIVAFANSNDPRHGRVNTSNAQFYITFGATPWLDGGYNVFGFVVDGYDVLDQMEHVAVTNSPMSGEHSFPVETYAISNCYIIPQDEATHSALRLVVNDDANGISTLSLASETSNGLTYQETTVYIGEEGFSAYIQNKLDALPLDLVAGETKTVTLPSEFGGDKIWYTVTKASGAGGYAIVSKDSYNSEFDIVSTQAGAQYTTVSITAQTAGGLTATATKDVFISPSRPEAAFVSTDETTIGTLAEGYSLVSSNFFDSPVQINVSFKTIEKYPLTQVPIEVSVDGVQYAYTVAVHAYDEETQTAIYELTLSLSETDKLDDGPHTVNVRSYLAVDQITDHRRLYSEDVLLNFVVDTKDLSITNAADPINVNVGDAGVIQIRTNKADYDGVNREDVTFALVNPDARPRFISLSTDGALSWADITSEDYGAYVVDVAASDALGNTAETRITFNVNDGSNLQYAPVFEELTGPLTATTGSIFIAQATATVPNSSSAIVQYALIGPRGMEIDPSTGVITWAIPPDYVSNAYAVSRDLNFTVVATAAFLQEDGSLRLGRSTEHEYSLNITNANYSNATYGVSLGVVYTEQYIESEGDLFSVAWVGGTADGATTLDSLVINLDKNQNGRLDTGEAIFDIEGANGVSSYVPFQLVSKSDEIGYDYQVEDGGQVLTINFTNFHEGDSLVFKIDLDEYLSPAMNSDPTTSMIGAQVEGAEMGGSIVDGQAGSFVTATFTSTHYQTLTETSMFVDQFDYEYDRAYFPELDSVYDDVQFPTDVVYANASDTIGDEGVARAGVLAKYGLTPKPIVISGYVYADHDIDCNYEPQDQDVPLSNVEVTLYDVKGAKVGVTKTDVNGYYEFSDSSLMPGKYQIISQSNVVSPSGDHYVDFCAKGGTFGVKIDPLEIDVEGMQGGDVADNNNFAKVLLATISGHVFEDFNDNGVKDAGESWDEVVNPVTVELYRIVTNEDESKKYVFMESQQVGADGYYQFDFDCSYGPDGEYRKLPGRTYEIREYQPSAYTDGKDHIGSLGGVQTQKGDVDVVSEIFVGYGQNGYNYNFGELKLGQIAGNVFEDRNDNGLFDSGEAGIAGVDIDLYRWNGSNYEYVKSTKTDSKGAYLFAELDINESYAVKERQPDEYDDGKDHIGALGGIVYVNDEMQDIYVQWDAKGERYDFGELVPSASDMRWNQESFAAETGSVFTATISATSSNLDVDKLAYELVDNAYPEALTLNAETGEVFWAIPEDYIADIHVLAVTRNFTVRATECFLEEDGTYTYGLCSEHTFAVKIANTNYIPGESDVSDTDFTLGDYPTYQSFKIDATKDAATLYGMEEDGSFTELQIRDNLDSDNSITLAGRDAAPDRLTVTANALSILGSIKFLGGGARLDMITIEGTENDDAFTITAEDVVVETPIYVNNPYESSLNFYAKTYGETDPRYLRIKANFDAAYERLSKLVSRKTLAYGTVSLADGANVSFLGVKDVSIDAKAGVDSFKVDALRFNYTLATDGIENVLDFSDATGRLSLDLGLKTPQYAILGDGGTLRLAGTFVTVEGTAKNDRIVGSSAGLNFTGNGGSESVTLTGGVNNVNVVGKNQSIIAIGDGEYNIVVESGDYSTVNAGGVTADGAVDVEIEGRGATVFGGLGTLEADIEGDNASVFAASSASANVSVTGDYAVVTTGRGDDSVVVVGAGANVRLGAGDDVAIVSDGDSGRVGNNSVSGEAGNDAIILANAGGSNYLYAGAGNDFVVGGRGNDFIHANAGKNILAGLGGADRLFGAAGRDVLIGSRTFRFETLENSTQEELLALRDQLYAAWVDEADLDATVALLGENSVADEAKDWIYRGGGKRNLIFANQEDGDFEDALENNPFFDSLKLE